MTYKPERKDITIYNLQRNSLTYITTQAIGEVKNTAEVVLQAIDNWSEIQVIKADVLLEMEFGIKRRK
jgi:hypothetical protein